ncbi:hypothetical protein AB2M62_17190 [Sphingomonas sp. MMS12-HWE2-04]|uniref:hypothetical protein n=1 Tax=Sphingomonas sp. MMS12-HWE2-04 TaxID=3234199 RepID=UPI00384ADA23
MRRARRAAGALRALGGRFGDALQALPARNPLVASILSTEPRETAARSTRFTAMIRKLASGQYRLYSRKKNPDTGKRRNLGTFDTKEAAQQHERDVQYFKRH